MLTAPQHTSSVLVLALTSCTRDGAGGFSVTNVPDADFQLKMTENKKDMDLFFVLKQTKMSNSKTISPLKVLFIFQDLGRHCNHYTNKHVHFWLQINLEEYA